MIIDGEKIINFQFYDEEHEEYTVKAIRIIDFLEKYSEEAVPTIEETAQPDVPDTNVGDMKEMAEVMVSKEAFVLAKDDKNYFDFISRETERRLMDRLASILKENGEVVVKMSDLRLNEVRELHSVQLRRQIKWRKLVLCRDCKHRDEGGFCLGRGYPEQLVPDDGYCDKGDRKEVKDAKS